MGKALVSTILGLLLFGCDISPPVGQLKCEIDDDCPPEWVCNIDGDGTCYPDEEDFPNNDGGPDGG